MPPNVYLQILIRLRGLERASMISSTILGLPRFTEWHGTFFEEELSTWFYLKYGRVVFYLDGYLFMLY